MRRLLIWCSRCLPTATTRKPRQISNGRSGISSIRAFRPTIPTARSAHKIRATSQAGCRASELRQWQLFRSPNLHTSCRLAAQLRWPASGILRCHTGTRNPRTSRYWSGDTRDPGASQIQRSSGTTKSRVISTPSLQLPGLAASHHGPSRDSYFEPVSTGIAPLHTRVLYEIPFPVFLVPVRRFR